MIEPVCLVAAGCGHAIVPQDEENIITDSLRTSWGRFLFTAQPPEEPDQPKQYRNADHLEYAGARSLPG